MVRRADQNVSKKMTEQMLLRAGWTCHYCACQWGCVVDHVQPASRGGSRAEDNLVVACNRCNSEKSDMTPGEWMQWRLERGMSWPPPNLQVVFRDFTKLFAEPEYESVNRAYSSYDERVWGFHARWLRKYHTGATPDHATDYAELMQIVGEFIAEQAVTPRSSA